MPCTHVGGIAGKKGTEAMQHRINVLRKNITMLENVVVERNDRIRQLRADNAKLRKLTRMMSTTLHCPTVGCTSDCELHGDDGCYVENTMRELGVECAGFDWRWTDEHPNSRC